MANKKEKKYSSRKVYRKHKVTILILREEIWKIWMLSKCSDLALERGTSGQGIQDNTFWH